MCDKVNVFAINHFFRQLACIYGKNLSQKQNMYFLQKNKKVLKYFLYFFFILADMIYNDMRGIHYTYTYNICLHGNHRETQVTDIYEILDKHCVQPQHRENIKFKKIIGF